MIALHRPELTLLWRKPGVVLTHNHPDGTSFSEADVRLAMRYRLAEVRVVGIGPAGLGWQYRLLRPIFGWPPWERTATVVAEVAAAVERAWLPQLVAGTMTEEYADLNGNHEVWLGVSRRLGLPYERNMIE